MEPEEILREMQKLISANNTSKELVATVPELRKEIAKLEKVEEVCKAELVVTNEQLVNMKIKNVQRRAAQKEKDAAEYSLEKKEERKKNGTTSVK